MKNTVRCANKDHRPLSVYNLTNPKSQKLVKTALSFFKSFYRNDYFKA